MRVQISALAIAPLIWMYPTSSYAQSRYLDVEANGIDIEAGYLTNQDEIGFTLNLGYSSRGMSDIGITLTRTSGDIDIDTLSKSPAIANLFDEDIVSFRVSPSISGYLLKQGEASPLSLGVGFAYVEEYFSGGTIDDSGLNVLTQGVEFSLYLDRKQPVIVDMHLFPRAFLKYHIFKATAGTGSGELYDNDSQLFWGFSLSSDLHLSELSTLLIIPTVIFDEERSIRYQVNLGYLFHIGKT